MIEQLSDRELIQLCIAGKEQGFARLYSRYAKTIFNSIYRLVNDVSEAEDLLQEVFVQVFSDTAKLHRLESFEGWTRRVAINLSISHLRKKKMFFVDIDEVHHLTIEQDDGNTDWIESRVADIQLAISELPHTAKTIVNLFVFEDMPQEEIAQVLSMSHIAVRSQYHRAKAKIAQIIKKKACYGRG